MNTSYILMIVTIVSKIFGLLREKALAYFFGTGIIVEAFLVAFQIPMTFTNILSGATANGYIPMYNEIKERSGEKEANSFTSNLSNIVFFGSLLISIVGIVFAKQLVIAMAIGFKGETLAMAVFMTRVALLSLAATTVFSIFKAYLQIKRHFIVSIAHAILMNVIIIVSMAFAKKMGYQYLAFGILSGFIFQYLIFLPYIKKSGYRHRSLINLKDRDFKMMMKIIIPVLISTSVIELNFIISKSLASDLFVGAMASLNYAYKLQAFVTGIVITSIVTAVYPDMARLGAVCDYDGLKKSVGGALVSMALLVVPASVGLFIFSSPIVKLLFVGGAFGKQEGVVTATVLNFYAIGIIGIGVREIVSRAFYAIMDTKTPVVNSVVMVGVNIVLSMVMMKVYGIRGLALATSISFIVGAILMVLSLKSRLGRMFSTINISDLMKITIATVCMGILASVVYSFSSRFIGSIVSLLIAIVVAGGVYLLAILVLKVSEVQNIINKIKNKRAK
ncbi:MAG: murein biosynthesis integral membrane protein MurJ [Peptoniphilus sp.]|uniref:murein biosynthesis integral membrane protein MurJ n=1 Tax=Peptoniphilus sp. TaxID=1971214 RepID=UPI002A74BA8F|nr:murein biosynthesis integral membrane protein MurJ [Peptoniphilus sp.]MDY2987963.1 murein biosynthesis integral membrane protein MurJ [Peptoniphilus sp.]